MRAIGILILLGVVAYVVYGYYLTQKDNQHTQRTNAQNGALSDEGKAGNLSFENPYGNQLKKLYSWFPG